jgi:hypothetical protein
MFYVQSNGSQAGVTLGFRPECTDGRFLYFVNNAGPYVLEVYDATMMGAPWINLTADPYVIGLGGFSQSLGEPGAADSCGAYVSDAQGVKLLAVAGQETHPLGSGVAGWLGPPFPVAGVLGNATAMVLAGGYLFVNVSGAIYRVAVPH